MTTLTPQIVGEVMRQRLGDENAAKAARYIYGIPEALKDTGRKVAANPRLRPLLTTDKSSVTGTIMAGKVDLAALYVSNQILLEYLDKGRIYHANNPYPLREIPPAIALLTQQFSDFYYFYIDGNYLYPIDSSKSALTGSLKFAVPYYPATLALLPTAEEVQNIFFDKLYEWCLSDQMPQNDGAEDGEK